MARMLRKKVVMKPLRSFFLAACLLSVACHRNETDATPGSQSYQVVPEGAASGVANTINAPGETAMTSTGADTSSSLDVLRNGATAAVNNGAMTTSTSTAAVSAIPGYQMPAPPTRAAGASTSTGTIEMRRSSTRTNPVPQPQVATETARENQRPAPDTATANDPRSGDEAQPEEPSDDSATDPSTPSTSTSTQR